MEGRGESAGLLPLPRGVAAAGGRAAAPPAQQKAGGARLAISTLQYVCCSLVSTTLFYRELYRLQRYPQFSNQLNTSGTVVTMGALSLLLLAPCCSTAEGAGGSSSGASSMAALGGKLFSAWLLLLLGLLNAAGNLLQLMAIDGLGARYSTLTTLLNQCTIPFTMLLSRLLLRNIYSTLQLLGAAVVIAGVAVAVSPSLSPDSGDGSGAAAGPSSGAVAGWIVVFVVSCFPQSLLTVLIEQWLPLPTPSVELAFSSGGARPGGASGLREVLLRTVALVCLMNLASAPFNLLGAVVASLSQHGELGPMWADYREGWGCLNGHDPLAHGSGSAAFGSEETVGCDRAWVDVVLFIPMGVSSPLSGLELPEIG
jgi:drug/metabolite transporter (DMT)-like permease